MMLEKVSDPVASYGELPSKKMKLLVIGGNGHYGGLITSHLSARHDIIVFDLDDSPCEFECKQVVGDILNRDQIERSAEGIDAIVTFFVGDASLSTMGMVNVMTAASSMALSTLSTPAARRRGITCRFLCS